VNDNEQGNGNPAGDGGGDGGSSGEELAYGGGHQQGGGMIEPEEFADGGIDDGLPNDALAEGLGGQSQGSGAGSSQERPEDFSTVDPAAAPPDNDTGTRVGDVTGFHGSDQVVEDPTAGQEGNASS
jgi:hypothetical protein